jgi:hypothetical protein
LENSWKIEILLTTRAIEASIALLTTFQFFAISIFFATWQPSYFFGGKKTVAVADNKYASTERFNLLFLWMC